MNIGRFLRGLALALVLLPLASFADSIDVFINTGGTAAYNPVTQTLTITSSITEVINQYGQVEQGGFGTLTVVTGPLISGSIGHHAFFSPGSIIVGSLTGTVGPLVWYQVPNSDEFHLAGGGSLILSGHPFGISNFNELLVVSGTNQFNVLEGRVGLVPEPSSLSLLITGLALFAGIGVSRVKRLNLN